MGETICSADRSVLVASAYTSPDGRIRLVEGETYLPFDLSAAGFRSLGPLIGHGKVNYRGVRDDHHVFEHAGGDYYEPVWRVRRPRPRDSLPWTRLQLDCGELIATFTDASHAWVSTRPSGLTVKESTVSFSFHYHRAADGRWVASAWDPAHVRPVTGFLTMAPLGSLRDITEVILPAVAAGLAGLSAIEPGSVNRKAGPPAGVTRRTSSLPRGHLVPPVGSKTPRDNAPFAWLSFVTLGVTAIVALPLIAVLLFIILAAAFASLSMVDVNEGWNPFYLVGATGCLLLAGVPRAVRRQQAESSPLRSREPKGGGLWASNLLRAAAVSSRADRAPVGPPTRRPEPTKTSTTKPLAPTPVLAASQVAERRASCRSSAAGSSQPGGPSGCAGCAGRHAAARPTTATQPSDPGTPRAVLLPARTHHVRRTRSHGFAATTAAWLLTAMGVVLVAASAAVAIGSGPAQQAAAATQAPAAAAPAPAAAEEAEEPVGLEIPAIGVSVAIKPVGLTSEQHMEVPAFGEAGWFHPGPRPGELGYAVMAGHVDSVTGPDVFYRLHTLEPGDEVRVRTSTGFVLTFRVDAVWRQPKEDMPGSAMWRPSDRSQLALITCAGTFDRKRRSYTDNLVVYATAA